MRRWLAATRVSTAPGRGASRYTVSPVATAASERVVGTPSACIASLITYSRSTGPNAARPSPPRENGVRPEPLSCMSRRRPSARDEFADQHRAPVAQLRREMAELMPGIGERQRFGALGHQVAGEDFRPRLLVVRNVDAEFVGQLAG